MAAASDLGILIQADIISQLTALDNGNPILPVAPVAEGVKKIFAAVQQLVQSQEPELVAAI